MYSSRPGLGLDGFGLGLESCIGNFFGITVKLNKLMIVFIIIIIIIPASPL